MTNSIVSRIEVLLRSAGVGAVATGVDLVALACFTEGFGVHPRVASAPALTFGVVVQFVGNKRFAFRDDDPAWVPPALRFAAVECAAFVANLLLFDWASRVCALPPVPLRVVTTGIVYVALCLPLWSRIFRNTRWEQRP